MVRSIAYFKERFVDGYVIQEEDIADWLDSFRHVSQTISLSDMTGLRQVLQDYRAKADKVPVGEVEGLATYLSAILANYISTGSQIAQSQVSGLEQVLADKATFAQAQAYIDGLNLKSGTDGAPGVSITEVSIDQDGYLLITLSNAQQINAGQLPSAKPAVTRLAYNWDILGTRDGQNKTFKLETGSWKPGSLRVYRQGAIMTPRGQDYTEGEDRSSVIFNQAVLPEENLVFEFEPTE